MSSSSSGFGGGSFPPPRGEDGGDASRLGSLPALRQPPKTYGFSTPSSPSTSSGGPAPGRLPALKPLGGGGSTPSLPALKPLGIPSGDTATSAPSLTGSNPSVEPTEKKERLWNDFAALVEQKKSMQSRPSSAISSSPSTIGTKDLSRAAPLGPSAKSLDGDKIASFDHGSGGATVFSPIGVKVDPSLGHTFKPGDLDALTRGPGESGASTPVVDDAVDHHHQHHVDQPALRNGNSGTSDVFHRGGDVVASSHASSPGGGGGVGDEGVGGTLSLSSIPSATPSHHRTEAYGAMPLIGTPDGAAPEPFSSPSTTAEASSTTIYTDIGDLRIGSGHDGGGGDDEASVSSPFDDLPESEQHRLIFLHLMQHHWFHGNMSSADAAIVLDGHPTGAFILRYSQRSGNFCSSYVTMDFRVQHTRFEPTPSNAFLECGTGRVWGTLEEMVTVFNHPGVPCTFDASPKPPQGDGETSGSTHDDASQSLHDTIDSQSLDHAAAAQLLDHAAATAAAAAPTSGSPPSSLSPSKTSTMDHGDPTIISDDAPSIDDSSAITTSAVVADDSPAAHLDLPGVTHSAPPEMETPSSPPEIEAPGSPPLPRCLQQKRLPKTASEELEYKGYQQAKYERQQQESAKNLLKLQRAQSLRAMGARKPSRKEFDIDTMRSAILSGRAKEAPNRIGQSAAGSFSAKAMHGRGGAAPALSFDRAVSDLVASLPEAPTHPVVPGVVPQSAMGQQREDGAPLSAGVGCATHSRTLPSGGDGSASPTRAATTPSASSSPAASAVSSSPVATQRRGPTFIEPPALATKRDVPLTLESATEALKETNEKRLRSSPFFSSMMSATPTNITNIMNKVYAERNSPPLDKKGRRKKKKKGLVMTTSKHVLTFNLEAGAAFPLHQPLADSVVLSNSSNKTAKFHFSTPTPAKTHEWIITPMKGELKKKLSVKITISLNIRTTMKLQEVLILHVKDYGPFFLVVDTQSERSVFGTIPDVPDLVIDQGLEVPSVLCSLREYLIDRDGLKEPGIFRTKPLDDGEVFFLKEKLNKDQFDTSTTCRDIHCISTLIKLWYRELPEPVLSMIPQDKLLETADVAGAAELLEGLYEPQRSITLWLLDLLAEAEMYAEHNGMSLRSLSAVVGPNLFNFSGIADPMRAMQLSQKGVAFVELALAWRVERRKAAGGGNVQ